MTAQIGGKNSAAATADSARFQRRCFAGSDCALDGDAAAQSAVLPMVAKRRISAAAPKVYALLDSEDAAVKAAAYDALSGVSSPADFDKLSQLLENAPAEYVGKIQAGLKKMRFRVFPPTSSMRKPPHAWLLPRTRLCIIPFWRRPAVRLLSTNSSRAIVPTARKRLWPLCCR
ncbi:MAG: hypothetical protein L6V35_02600 [Alistipes putredinis]|nr:MAG: hypothetical protein L6V35_02600 [Alistipes putredinis]